MADPYVIFPGTAGNYLSTADVNLLDADTAHLYQSLGKWKARSGITQLQTVVSADADIGDKVLQGELTATSGEFADGAFDDFHVVSPGQIITVSVDVKPERDSDWQTQIVWYNDSGGFISASGKAFETVTGGVWQRMDFTATAPALAARAHAIYTPINAQVGDVVLFKSDCWRLDGEAVFERSLRIVGTLFEETVPVDMPIVFAGDGTPLTIGDGWAGDGYSYHRYDGADASAPLVASFLATDIPVAAQLPA